MILALSLAVGCACEKEAPPTASTAAPYGKTTEEGSKRKHAWKAPPLPGEDSDYEGPPPDHDWGKSPYNLPFLRAELRRLAPRDEGDPGFNERLAETVKRTTARIAYLGDRNPGRFAFLEDRLVIAQASDFETEDDRIPFEKLKTLGAGFLLVDTSTPSPMPWVDRRATVVRHRLRDALGTDFIHPLLIGRTYALFRLAEPLRLGRSDMRRITQKIRAVLSGEARVPAQVRSIGGSMTKRPFTLVVTLRSRRMTELGGQPILSRIASGRTIDETAGLAARRVLEAYRRHHQTLRDRFKAPLPDAMDTLLPSIEIEGHLLVDVCEICDRQSDRIAWILEPGAHGLYLWGRSGLKYLLPGHAVEKGIEREAALAEALGTENQLPAEAWRSPENEFGRFRVLSWIERAPDGEAIPLYRAQPLRRVEEVTRDTLARAATLSANRLVGSQAKTGAFPYAYRTLEPEPSRRWIWNGPLDQEALAPFALSEAAAVVPCPSCREAARRALDRILKNLERDGDRCFIRHRDRLDRYDNVRMDVLALAILGILGASDTPMREEDRDILNCLGEEALHMQDPNGHFRQFDVALTHPYYGVEEFSFPGMMALALSRLSRATDEARYRDSVDRAVSFYATWWDLAVQRRTRDGIYTEERRARLFGFAPWFVMAMEDMAAWTGDIRYATLGLALQDWLEDTLLVDAKSAPFPDYAGAFFEAHHRLPGSSSFLPIASAAAALGLARRSGQDIGPRQDTVLLGARFLLQSRLDDDSLYFAPDPASAIGGFRQSLADVRIQHDALSLGLAALSRCLAALKEEDHDQER